MKLNPDFLTHTTDGVTLLVPVADAKFHGLVQGNRSVKVILDCLKKDTTEEEIVNTMCEVFDGDRALIEEDVLDVLSRLKEIGAIDEETKI